MPPEAKETSPLIVLAPMPGGALTANTMMMRDNNTLHLYPKVIEEMAEVVARGGYGTSVTPVSQFYIQQAYMNVVMGKWKKITEGYGNMVLGYFGKTPRPADPEIVKIASEQLKKEPFTAADPLDIIEPGIEKARKILLDNNIADTDENIFIIATCEAKGLEFLKGNATLSVYYKPVEKKVEEKPASPPPPAQTTPTLPQSMIVNVNGKDYNVSVRESGTAKPEIITPKPEPTTAKPESPKPVQTGSRTIKAPMAGVVLRVLVSPGDQVKVDQTVAVLEAMKMENEIFSDFAGTIVQVCVSAGESVNEGKVLIEVRG
jgi:pyruvate carboxylase subunit B